MKKLLVILLALLMVLGFAGCGEYKPPVVVGNPNGTGDGPGSTVQPGPGPVTPQDAPFTVSLYNISDNEPFTAAEDISALWHDMEGSAIYTAPFNAEGVASITGLDGDYTVTLSALPDGYTYNPNNHIATNDDRDIKIYMYRINYPIGTVTGYPNISGTPHEWTMNDINGTRGAFRATINAPDDIVRFQYKTSNLGEYSIESIIDTTANVINPILEVYDGSFAYINYNSRKVYDDGGSAVNSYTKNFRYEETMAEGCVFIFCIRAEGLNANAFPIDIDFLIDKDGELTPPDQLEMAVAKEAKPYNFTRSGSFKYVASLDTTGRNILNGKLFRLDDRAEVDGSPNPEYGHYRFYDETTGYGGTLFTKINRDWEFTPTQSGSGFLDGYVIAGCRFYGYNYYNFLQTYASLTNSDGVYPVTQELKDFLMGYSIAQAYFSDGNGWAETVGHYNSSESNQWLFSCGYYNK